MKLILKEDVANLGFKDEVVEVKPGYGRNFLIPQGLAVIASESALKVLAENQRQQAKKLEAIKDAAQKMADKMENAKVELLVKTSATGSVYGSVTSAQVADELEKQGFEINRKMLKMSTIKNLGEYTAQVRLHRDVTVDVPVIVRSENIVAPKAAAEAPAENAEPVTEETTEE